MNAKKDIKKGLNSLLGDKSTTTGTRNQEQKQETTTGTRNQEPGKTKPFNFRIKIDLLEKIKTLANNTGYSITDIISISLNQFIQQYETKNGKIKPVKKKPLF